MKLCKKADLVAKQVKLSKAESEGMCCEVIINEAPIDFV